MELSDVYLYPRLTPGAAPAGEPDAVLTPYVWPAYRRTTLAAGGDAKADFSITGDVVDEASMELWLESWLAGHVVERYNAQDCFWGRVHTLRLTYNGIFLVHSLDTCWNRIYCRYTSVVTGSAAMAGPVEDAASQAVWGVRELILQPEDVIGAAEAADLAGQALADLAYPRIWRGDVDLARAQRAVLRVEVEGYPATLDVKHHTSLSSATEDADAAVTAVLAGADYVTAGKIAANSTQVTRQSDYRPALQRLRFVAGRRDAAGSRYNYGCVGSLDFDYQPADEVGVRYTLEMKRQRPLIFDADGQYVPAPLVRPGGVSLVGDVMAGRARAAALLADPRAQFDEAVEYGRDGAKLRGKFELGDRVQALNMALVAARRNT